MYVVDASVWVSYFIRSEATSLASREWVTRQADIGAPILGPSIVLAEIAGAISRRTQREELGQMTSKLVSRLPGFRMILIDQELADLSVSVAAGMRLKGADAIYVALASLVSAPLVTWDKEQIERGAQIVFTQTPTED